MLKQLTLIYKLNKINITYLNHVLFLQINNKAIDKMSLSNNLELTSPDSELITEIIKDEYNLEFLSSINGVKELDLEKDMIKNICNVLMELGGHHWTFVGRQVHLEIGNQDFYLDLLFYHRKLKRLIVVDLKIDDFKPEYYNQGR